MSAKHFVTFAYGSNMLAARIRARCPSAQPLGVAELSGYELRCHKRSKDGSGKFDVVQVGGHGSSVFGVLYEIADGDKSELDRAEGLGHGYTEVEVKVLMHGELVTAKAYVATKTDSSLKPYSWYLALTVAGAKENGLPPDYIARLEAISADKDPDQTQHDQNMALIQGGHS